MSATTITIDNYFRVTFFHGFFSFRSDLFKSLVKEKKKSVPYPIFALIVCFNSKHTALWLAHFQNRMHTSLKWLVSHGECFLVGWMLFNFRKNSHRG